MVDQSQIFAPHPGAQTDFERSMADWLLYGGARGGGKSFELAKKTAYQPRDWHFEWRGRIIDPTTYQELRQQDKTPDIIIDKVSVDYPTYRGLLVRKSFPQLERNLKPECDKLYLSQGAIYKAKYHRYEFPSGAVIILVHLNDRQAVEDYIGGNYHFLGVDEANQFPWEWIEMISSSVRSSIPEIQPQICLTANPGNVGHNALKSRFVKRCPPTQVRTEWSEEFEMEYPVRTPGEAFVDSEGISWQFIPATVFDNPTLIENDKMYIRRLKNLPPTLKAMWLMGDWDVFQGMYFDMWREDVHVIPSEHYQFGKHFTLNDHMLYRTVDYGTKAPMACYFATVDRHGYLVFFDEIYMSGLAASEQAKYINKYTEDEYGLAPTDFAEFVADTQMWAKDSEKDGMKYSPAEFYADENLFLTQASKDRKVGAKVVYDGLTPPKNAEGEITGPPRIRFTDNCVRAIETIPALPNDENDPEDVDTDAEDHSYDAIRYLAMEILSGPTYAPTEERGENWRKDRLMTDMGGNRSAKAWMAQ